MRNVPPGIQTIFSNGGLFGAGDSLCGKVALTVLLITFLSGIFVNLASLVSLREPIFGFFLPPRRYASKAKLFFTPFSSPPQQRGRKRGGRSPIIPHRAPAR